MNATALCECKEEAVPIKVSIKVYHGDRNYETSANFVAA